MRTPSKARDLERRGTRKGHGLGQIGESGLPDGRGQRIPIGGQAVGEDTEGLHRPGIDDGEHRDTETLGQIGARGLPVEQPHDALDHDQLRLARGGMEQTPAFGLADHSEFELIDRLPAGPNHDALTRLTERRSARA
jgi:hypothetical protein